MLSLRIKLCCWKIANALFRNFIMWHYFHIDIFSSGLACSFGYEQFSFSMYHFLLFIIRHLWIYLQMVTRRDITVSVVFVASSGSLTVNPDGSVHILAEEACELSDLDVNVSTSTGNVHVHKLWSHGSLMRIHGLKFFLYTGTCITNICANFEIEFFWYRIVFSNSS